MIEVTPGPLPIHFCTIVVKASAIDRSFPGGQKSFIGSHSPGSCNGTLFCIPSMGSEGVDWHLERLAGIGIVAGLDLAVADMLHGPLLECPGIVFTSSCELLLTSWMADLEETADADRERSRDEAPGSPLERLDGDGAPEWPSSPRTPSGDFERSWRRHAVPGGLVFWFGGDEDEE